MMSKVYKCQFCSFHGTKEKLVSHVESKHPEMIPEGFTAGRTVFNYINHKDHGVCVVCKRPTEWNEDRLKYNRLCGRESCKKALREKYSKNMIRVHGTDNLLTDMEQQEKMLKNRRISGKYRFTDGGYCTYTGKYELKTLEFLDKVLGYTSNEILTPGPIVEYEYQGKKLKWILDILIIPYNLVIDVKDGGDNPNNREMKSYREKQIAKESDIKKLGQFNYLRLTNNNFEQLIHILAELKMQMIDSTYEDGRAIIRVHEEYIEEASGLKKLHCLPIDTTQCKPNEYVGCFNTHIINHTKTVATSIGIWTLVSMAYGVAFFNALKSMTMFIGAINLPVYIEQSFARDFLLINKNPKKDIADDFEGFKALSCNDGIVELTQKMKFPYGNVIVIKHDDHLYSVYAHLATKGILVKKGQKVKKGQVIGIVGNTGNSTAPHLHFELLFTSIDYMPIGRPLNGFEPFYTKNASNNMLDLANMSKFLNITNGKWKLDTTGEIPSFCVIKSQNDLHEDYIEEAVDTRFSKDYHSLDQFCQYIRTPEEVSKWFFYNNVRWYDDKQLNKIEKEYGFKHIYNNGDEMVFWPKIILKYKLGVCFDFATFMVMCCMKYGLECGMIYIGANGKIDTKYTNERRMLLGHAVAYYKIPNEGYYIFNYMTNMGSILGPYDSINDMEKNYEKFFKQLYTKLGILNFPEVNKILYTIQSNKKELDLYNYYEDKVMEQNELLEKFPTVVKWLKKLEANTGEKYMMYDIIDTIRDIVKFN